MADEQTAGRGRLGKTFFSPPGGLYVSLILRPALEPARTPLIGLALGLAVVEAIRELAPPLEPALKWPNDVLVGGRKVCGVLIDLASSAQRVRWAVAGFGVNVNIPALPAELRLSATSLLQELGYPMDLETTRDNVLGHFESRYMELLDAGSAPLLAAWTAGSCTLGQIVRISAADQQFEGVAERLDTDGALMLRANGELRRVVAGEVHLLGPTSGC